MTGTSAELQLLFACAVWPDSPERRRAVSEAADGIDVDRFAQLCLRHRMAGMAVDALSRARVPVAPSLRDAARADLLQAMQIAAEAVRLSDLLAGERIATTVLKGPALAQLIYGTLAVRQTRDLDLLVGTADLEGAINLLTREGYQLSYAGSDAALRPDRSFLLKDVELRHPITGLLVELHVRLGENDALLPVSGLDAPEQVALAPGKLVATLTGRTLLLYLIVHGFRHGWHRLKWLADVTTMLAAMSPQSRTSFVAETHARGLAVVVDSTLLLAQQTIVPDAEWIDPALASRRARWCAAIAERHLRDAREVDHQVLTRLLVTATMLLASIRPRYLWEEAKRLLVDPGLMRALQGRPGALVLAVVLRPLVLPGRHLLRLLKRR